jgi:hypothetical protein
MPGSWGGAGKIFAGALILVVRPPAHRLNLLQAFGHGLFQGEGIALRLFLPQSGFGGGRHLCAGQHPRQWGLGLAVNALPLAVPVLLALQLETRVEVFY